MDYSNYQHYQNPSAHHNPQLGPSPHHFNQERPSSTLPPIRTPKSRSKKYISRDKGRSRRTPKSKNNMFGEDFMQMMVMMKMFQSGRSQIDPVDHQIKKQIERQNQAMINLRKPRRQLQNNRKMISRIQKIERKMQEAMDETDTKNPVMDLFFLQNIMMTQNGLSSQFRPDKDEKSKRLQGFMLSQLMRQFTGVRDHNSSYVMVIFLPFLIFLTFYCTNKLEIEERKRKRKIIGAAQKRNG